MLKINVYFWKQLSIFERKHYLMNIDTLLKLLNKNI